MGGFKGSCGVSFSGVVALDIVFPSWRWVLGLLPIVVKLMIFGGFMQREW